MTKIPNTCIYCITPGMVSLIPVETRTGICYLGRYLVEGSLRIGKL
jgi:hypothetical protein